ncbi:hypothetical protein WS46_24645 [Burkholderia sp. RF4-BP95]|nr:hypothetical protein WS46_24645 [Burkholderia sp. RF4-BP95]
MESGGRHGRTRCGAARRATGHTHAAPGSRKPNVQHTIIAGFAGAQRVFALRTVRRAVVGARDHAVASDMAGDERSL